MKIEIEEDDFLISGLALSIAIAIISELSTDSIEETKIMIAAKAFHAFQHMPSEDLQKIKTVMIESSKIPGFKLFV